MASAKPRDPLLYETSTGEKKITSTGEKKMTSTGEKKITSTEEKKIRQRLADSFMAHV